MATATKAQAKAASNGKPNGEPTPEQKLAQAIEHEEAIRVEAEAIWDRFRDDLEDGKIRVIGGEALGISAALLRELRPLLRRSIPSGFIEHVGEVSGKPYESTGVKSVQVQMDRLDNVLGPENWGYRATYEADGKLCYVVAWIGPNDAPLVIRDSWGGVRAGSGEGNIRKGAFTNAAKLAFARLGPAWEVYVGAADFDPDTDKAAAEAQEAADESGQIDTIDAERVADLVTTYKDAKDGSDDSAKFAREMKLKLGSMGVPTPSINKAFAALTPLQADEVEQYLGAAKGGAE